MLKKGNKKTNVLWVDDELEERHLFYLKEDCDIRLVQSGSEALKILNKTAFDKYDRIVTDLKMPELNGIQFYDKLPVFYKMKTVVCSANLMHETFNSKMRVRGLDESKQIDAEAIVDPDEITMSVLGKLNQENTTKEELIYNLSCEQYYSFSLDEKKYVYDFIYNLKEEEMHVELNRLKAQWLLFSKNEVIKFGSDLIPTIDEIYEVAQEIDAPVFLFTRPFISEESCSGAQKSKWSYYNQINGRDTYYPSVEMVLNLEKEPTLTADFDTGTLECFMSSEYYFSVLSENENIAEKERIQPNRSRINGENFFSYSKNIKVIFIKPNGDRIEKNIRVLMVIDWFNTWFTSIYKSRDALFGRDLLEKNNLKILLDGKERKTEIM